MLKKLSLSQKVLVIFLPLFLVAAGLSIFVNYQNQETLAIDLLRGTAESQATIIKESLVHMMITNQRVEDEYLSRINRAGQIQNLKVWFMLDSLHLDPDLLTPSRIRKLRSRELRITKENQEYCTQLFSTGEPLWLVQCDLGTHTDGMIEVFSTGRPLWFHSCERLKVMLPFQAESRCQECHNVPTGKVLGAAYMKMPLGQATAAFETNAQRSAFIMVLFISIAIAIGAFTFRKFISRPVHQLVDATKIIGSGNLDHRIQSGFDKDEFGILAESFDQMQDRLKQAQEKVIHEERLSTVGRMASGIIHDFRSPMNAILLALDILQRNGSSLQNKGKDLIKSIRSSLERMQRMTQELLDYSRGEVTLNPQRTNGDEFIKGIHTVAGESLEKKGIDLTAESNCPREMIIDPDRLQRALINVINNAEDAMPTGGSIRMIANVEDGSWFIRLSDTGGGIPEVIRETIFNPFVTAGKSKGTGLGLAITKEIIEQHGGTISFQTEIGRGTTFIIKLPLDAKPEMHVTAS